MRPLTTESFINFANMLCISRTNNSSRQVRVCWLLGSDPRKGVEVAWQLTKIRPAVLRGASHIPRQE